MKKIIVVLFTFLIFDGCALLRVPEQTVKAVGTTIETTGKVVEVTGKVVATGGEVVEKIAEAGAKTAQAAIKTPGVKEAVINQLSH